MAQIRSTTVVGVSRDGKTTIAADGQVTLGEATVLKHGARKVRRLAGGKVICGFAGSVADAQALLERLEAKLEAHGGSLRRAAVEFAKDWRTDKVLRNLNAMILAADRDGLLFLSGDGNVIEPDDGVAGIGSGGPYAVAAARALTAHTGMDVESIAREALKIAAELCVFTNDQVLVESI
ncbi:MAG TPA: ATP-dependent protease subunit HslV [Fimbriimonadaceae bacterium]|nr:ATP-dependent protease subunit HslV [Fimbriimonadaceae bacterium]